MNSPKVVVEGLCKVFGTSPKQAIDMLAGGATKEEVVRAHRPDRRRPQRVVRSEGRRDLRADGPVRLGQVDADSPPSTGSSSRRRARC